MAKQLADDELTKKKIRKREAESASCVAHSPFL